MKKAALTAGGGVHDEVDAGTAGGGVHEGVGDEAADGGVHEQEGDEVADGGVHEQVDEGDDDDDACSQRSEATVYNPAFSVDDGDDDGGAAMSPADLGVGGDGGVNDLGGVEESDDEGEGGYGPSGVNGAVQEELMFGVYASDDDGTGVGVSDKGPDFSKAVSLTCSSIFSGVTSVLPSFPESAVEFRVLRSKLFQVKIEAAGSDTAHNGTYRIQIPWCHIHALEILEEEDDPHADKEEGVGKAVQEEVAERTEGVSDDDDHSHGSIPEVFKSRHACVCIHRYFARS
jgi:hypothetical protein